MFRTSQSRIGLSSILLDAFPIPDLFSPGSVTAVNSVPSYIEKPDYSKIPPENTFPKIPIKSRKEILAAIEAGKLAAEILNYAASLVLPQGTSSNDIDAAVHKEIVRVGAYPSPLGYKGFLKSIATSINDVVVHGIPDTRKLQPGDVINIDITVFYKGMHGDTSRTFIVLPRNESHSNSHYYLWDFAHRKSYGRCLHNTTNPNNIAPSETESLTTWTPDSVFTPNLSGLANSDSFKVIKCAYESMWAGINIVSPNCLFEKIGDVCESISDIYDFGMVTEFCGHGIGSTFHEPPLILHKRKEASVYYKAERKFSPQMAPGMIFTIEPIVTTGRSDITKAQFDDWTYLSRDGSISAQAEHTLLVSESGRMVLTKAETTSEYRPTITGLD